jgi:UDP-galactopyranose mutase
VQDDNHRKHLKKAKDYFEGVGIPLCGRVAEFEYINMDVCIERGRKLADRLNQAGPAVTQPSTEVGVHT